MQATLEKIDIKKIEQSWVAFDQEAHLSTIHNDDEYDRTVSFMNLLIDVVGDNETHPMAGLLDLVSSLVSHYDQEYYAIETSSPKDVLQYLLDIKNLKQKDLESIVPQGNLSSILTGKRKISASLAGKLATFFNVSPAVFIAKSF